MDHPKKHQLIQKAPISYTTLNVTRRQIQIIFTMYLLIIIQDTKGLCFKQKHVNKFLLNVFHLQYLLVY